jgi:hypothetical protein
MAEVATNFDMTNAVAKTHLTILLEGNLISVKAVDRSRMNALNPDGLRMVNDWFAAGHRSIRSDIGA